MKQYNYLIIAGISKAGTTSLFDYLVAHPEVEGSSIKQTFFFLDKDLQKELNLNLLYDYEKGLDQFENFFHELHPQTKYRIEATPDYLYSLGTPNRLADFFKIYSGKVLIILRNPVSRFNSFYYFGKQQGLIPENMSYETFYQQAKEYTENKNPCLMAYKTGFYAQYLKTYQDKFEEGLEVIFFEDLKNDPKGLMQGICSFLGISSDFYENYKFEISNPTVKVKYRVLAKIYGGLRQFYLDYFFKMKAGNDFARFLKKSITPIYRKLNYRPLEKNNDNEINERLRQDYARDVSELEEIIQKVVPWQEY